MNMNPIRQVNLKVSVQVVFISLGFSFLSAQTNMENFAQFEFNFNNPGARAAGIGGAFIAIADDATAAEANPAGLTVLLEPEVSIDLKIINYQTNTIKYEGEGLQGDIILTDGSFEDTVFSPAFISFAYPTENLSLSAFRHELVNLESSFSMDPILLIRPDDQFTLWDSLGSDLNFSVVNWGLAVGFEINDKVAIGFSGGVSQFSIYSRLLRFRGSPMGTRFEMNDDDSDLFFNVGVLLRASSGLTVGATFKRRPRFSATLRSTSEATEVNFKIPTAYGFGVAYRPNDSWTLSLDLVTISYSDLTDDFIRTKDNYITNSNDTGDFTSKNGVELHVGTEYITFWKSFGLVFRGGLYREPDKSIVYLGNTPRAKELFRKGKQSYHLTAGLGVLTSGNLQVDFAGNLSERSDEVVMSLVYRL